MIRSQTRILQGLLTLYYSVIDSSAKRTSIRTVDKINLSDRKKTQLPLALFSLEVIYKPVGCFKDDTSEPRPLPVLVKNFRRPPQVDWNNLNNTIKACAERVQKAGYLYFGLQFYGECWSGPRAYLTYDEDGKSNRCEYGVGKGFANFVYRLVFEGNVKCKTKGSFSMSRSWPRSVGCLYSHSF